MDKNKNCSACNIKLDINNYKKDRTVCRDCIIKRKERTILTLYLQIKLILLTINHLLKITITIERFWLDRLFREKHI